MLKRLLSLTMLSLFLFSFSSSFAQIGDEDYSAQIKASKESLGQVKKEYIQAKKEARKAAMESFLSFGKTKEEKEARKKVLHEAKKKSAELREAYKGAKDALKNEEKILKEARKKAKQGKEKAEKKQKKHTKGLGEGQKKGFGKSKK
ncbi:MAG: hypothetical protein KAJ66_02785 [Candidatus Omnitrophica bacterium]|nr:hypothetical protein [Candidatus Omnitrophota bacterium]